MTSLRPLATIALLAAVGVFLYMKINESEPKLSPELEEWSTSTLEVGGADDLVGASGGASAPAPAAIGGDAPPFGAAALNPPAATPSAAVPPAGDEAPAWAPGPLTVGAGPADAAPADEESSPVARSAETPAVPDIPPMPGDNAVAAVPPAADAAEVAPPPTDNVASAAVAAAEATNEPTYGASPSGAAPQQSMFAAARVAVQGALDRGELAQALLLLSDWYGDPSLTPGETQEVNDLLAQLAGSVIYEGPPAHRLLPAHIVQAGETLESIASKYDVPWQLLAKINGVAEPQGLAPGQELKVVQGPFSALIDLSERRMTLMLDRRYAGQFAVEIDPAVTIEEGQWKVDQKLLTPASAAIYGPPAGAAEDRSLLLANLANPDGPAAVVRGPGSADPASIEPRGRVLRLKAAEVGDVYDILSVGSRVTIRR